MRSVRNLIQFATDVRAVMGPTGKGLLQGFANIAAAAVVIGVVLAASSAGSPSPELFDHLSQAGIGLLVAYSVTLAGIGRGRSSLEDHRNWLGFGTGAGLAALLGIGGCLAFSVQEADPSRAVALFCMTWTTVSLVALGFAVVLGPLMSFESALGEEASAAGGDPQQGSGGAEGASGDVGRR